MALDLGESLLECDGVHPESLAKRFAISYRWNRGYGPGAARVLKRIQRGEPWEDASKAVYAEGSYGNGAAMRAPVLALFFVRDRAGLIAAARDSARVTHAHPIGIEGAVLIALAANALLEERASVQVLELVQTECSTQQLLKPLNKVMAWIESDENPSPREVAKQLGNGITAHKSCLTALYVSLRYLNSSFEAMMEFIIACRGDVDTIAAMSGALWGIVNGASRLPQVNLESRDVIEDIAMRLYWRHLQVGAS